MNEEKLIPVPVGPKGVQLNDLDSMFRFAACYLQSGLAPQSFKNPQQLVIAWAKAAELGLSPLQAVEGMSIINNRVGIMGDLALAMVEASGLLEAKKVEYEGEDDDLSCTVTLTRKGRKPVAYTFSVQEAIVAQIYQRNPVWRAYPKRMTYYRALGFGLRDEFPDILKGTKTVEELQDYPDSVNDEEKIRDNQRREAEMKASETPGVKFVPGHGEQPSPEKALEPAFPEDLAPPFARQLTEDFPPPPLPPKKAPSPKPAASGLVPPMAAQPPDDLDMGTEEAPSKEQGPPAPQGSTAEVVAPAAAEPVTPIWKEHVILGVNHVKFHKKRVGDLKPAELAIIENQWLPAVRERWDEATDEQRADATAFESAIAYNKMAKPW